MLFGGTSVSLLLYSSARIVLIQCVWLVIVLSDLIMNNTLFLGTYPGLTKGVDAEISVINNSVPQDEYLPYRWNRIH